MLIERLDEAVESILAGRPSPVVDGELMMLAALAVDLCDLPDPAFRMELRMKLVPTIADVKPGFQTITPYFVVKGAAKFINFLEEVLG